MPVKVLQVLGRSAGGMAAHVAQVTSALNESGDFVVDVAADPDVPVAMPVRVHPVVIPRRAWGHRRAIRALTAIIERRGARVVHAHGLRAGIDAARAARRSGIPSLVTVHNLVQPEIAGALRARAYRLSEPLVVRLNTRTFAVSEQIASHLRTAAPRAASTIEVLYLGTGPPPPVRRTADEVRAELEVPPHAALIVSVARLRPQKALHVALEALGHVEAAVLAVVGEGALLEDLRERARSLGVGDRVRWLGWRRDVPDLVAAADAFCLSSIWEGVPLAAQEAILLGTPLVATDVGGMGELVEHGVSGWLVPRDDPRALGAALDEAVTDRKTAEERARRARDRLTARFSTERMLARLADVYREHAESGPR